MVDTPPPKSILDRLKTLLPGGGEAGGTPHPRWPHRTQVWLDPNVPLHGWRNRIDVDDAPEALRAIADTSEGRIDEAGLAEVLDAISGDKEPASFRFGASDAYRQIWIGVSPEETGGIRLFVLSDALHTERIESALSVAGFQHPQKRLEYDQLAKFLVAVWEWRGTHGSSVAHVQAHDAAMIAARLDRLVSDPQSPALEVLRGLRMRTRELLAELGKLDEGGVTKADAWLSSRGAPTLSQIRRAMQR
jgi:hypothetical protein